MEKIVETKIFEAVVADPDDDGGLSEKAQDVEPGNFLRHIVSLSLSKLADGLINPKLVLSWLLTHLGAGPFWAGLLVPIRESLALLPQIMIAPRVSARPIRKVFWAGGALVQGVCAAGIALIGLTQEGAAAGAMIVMLLAVLAMARSVCSASYKDTLGKTVGATRRGTATGFASSTAAFGVIAFALILMIAPIDRYAIVIGGIGLAGLAWIVAASVFATMKELPSDTSAKIQTGAQLGVLKSDHQLVRFIAVRSLLVGTALSPPFLVMMQDDSALRALGALVLASSFASLLSSFVWGRLSDRSSRRVLGYAGAVGAAALLLAAAAFAAGLTQNGFVIPVLLFALMIAYEGVRQGRSTHLVDMAPSDLRASYTALSNTIVGIFLLLAGGAFAMLSSVGLALVIALMAVMCGAGAILALGLEEVQND